MVSRRLAFVSTAIAFAVGLGAACLSKTYAEQNQDACLLQGIGGNGQAVAFVSFHLFGSEQGEATASPAGDNKHAPSSPAAVTPAGIKKFQKVDDILYRGAQPDARGFKELEKIGIRTVINLRKLHSDRRMLAGTSLRYRHIGMNVWHAEDEDVIEFLRLVKDRSKGPFFIHCEQGVDRTGFMCAIYRVVVHGWSKDKALAEMRSFRPHRIWINLENYIRGMDVQAIRKKAGLPPPGRKGRNTSPRPGRRGR